MVKNTILVHESVSKESSRLVGAPWWQEKLTSDEEDLEMGEVKRFSNDVWKRRWKFITQIF